MVSRDNKYSSLDGKLAHGEGPQTTQGLGGLQALLVGGQGLADGAGLLGPQVKGLKKINGYYNVQQIQVTFQLCGP